MGSGITFFISDLSDPTENFKEHGQIEPKVDYQSKIWHSYRLSLVLKSLTLALQEQKSRKFQDSSIGLLDQCLGALVLQHTRKDGKIHLTFIETSELKQSFQTYASGLNAIKPNVLAFEHINSKLKFRLQQCSLISKQGMVKLLAILKQNQVSLGNKPKIKLILQTKTKVLIHF
jgi:hypothetical protein